MKIVSIHTVKSGFLSLIVACEAAAGYFLAHYVITVERERFSPCVNEQTVLVCGLVLSRGLNNKILVGVFTSHIPLFRVIVVHLWINVDRSFVRRTDDYRLQALIARYVYCSLVT